MSASMRLRLALCRDLLTCGIAGAEPAAAESVQDALCRLIEHASRQHGVPADFLTNLLWRESSFRAGVVSPKGAQGIASSCRRRRARAGCSIRSIPRRRFRRRRA